MSLETLLEAAEFLEWSRPGKKIGSREVKSKKTAKYHPYERKKSSSDDANESDDLKEVKRSVGTRETHNKLEKNRRAHLRECFELLRMQLPNAEERRTSNLATLRSSIRLIETLVSQQKDLEHEKRKVQKLHSTRQAKLNNLKRDLKDKGIEYNLDDWLLKKDNETNSTSTASECGVSETEESNVTNLAASSTAFEKGSATLSSPMPTQPHGKVLSNSPKRAAKQSNNLDQVIVEAPPKAIQMMHQAAMKASLQKQLILKTDSGQTIPFTPVTQQANQPVLAVTQLPNNAVLRPKVPTAGIITPALTANQQPVTISLQTGKFFNPRRAFPKSTSVDLSYNADGALNIAPKGLVLITTDQNKFRGIATAVPHATASSTTNSAAMTPIVSVAGLQNSMLQQTHPSGTIDMIPISSLPGTVTSCPPTLLRGMLPTTAADGSVSYVPVTLTTNPVSVSTTQNVIIPSQEVISQPGNGQPFAVILSSVATTTATNFVTSLAATTVAK